MQYQTRSIDAGQAAIAARKASGLPADARAAVEPAAARASASAASSLLMSGAWVRVVGALGLIVLLWLAVGWALSGVGA